MLFYSIDDLTAGTVITGVSVIGWHTNPPAVIFRDTATDMLSAARLPLANATSGAKLDGAMPPLVTLPDMLFAVDTNSPAHVWQFDLDGKQLNTLDLSATYDSISFGSGVMGRVFLSVERKDNSACPYALVEWTIGP